MMSPSLSGGASAVSMLGVRQLGAMTTAFDGFPQSCRWWRTSLALATAAAIQAPGHEASETGEAVIHMREIANRRAWADQGASEGSRCARHPRLRQGMTPRLARAIAPVTQAC